MVHKKLTRSEWVRGVKSCCDVIAFLTKRPKIIARSDSGLLADAINQLELLKRMTEILIDKITEKENGK